MELDLLRNTAEIAHTHARRHRPLRGYVELIYGLERARITEDVWTSELETRWREALLDYAREWMGRG